MWNPFAKSRGPRPFERPAESEVDDELEFHLERRIADYVARGMTPDEARSAALARFGNLRHVRRECTTLLAADRQAAQRRNWFSDLRQDLRHGIRSLSASPLFTLLAIVTLGLGIGANAAVFSVVKSVLLDPLPYEDGTRLMRIYGRFMAYESEDGPLSAGTVADIRQRVGSFERLGAFLGLTRDAVISGNDGPRPTKTAWVQPEMLRTLGVRPALGRSFVDDDMGDTARVVILTHDAWRVRFGADPEILGRDVRIDGLPRTVVGVLPRGFAGITEGDGEAEFYFPIGLDPFLRDPISARRSHMLGLVGRLKPGVTAEAADRELAALGDALREEHPVANASIGLKGVPLRDAFAGEVARPLLVLMASAGLVLLIACANLAGALLSRTLTRRKEFAVRVAIGAGRGRLVRQLLTESVLLAVAGGVAGLLIAKLVLDALGTLALTALPAYTDLALDPAVVGLMAAVTIGTGLAFGIAPALAVGRTDPHATMRLESRGASESLRSRRLRGLLVAGQIALCISVLAGAGLLARSLQAMLEAPLGFRPEGIMTARLNLPASRYESAERVVAFKERYEERLRALPGVRAVASVSQLPTTVTSRQGFTIVGAARAPDEQQPFILFSVVSDDYFRMMGIPLRDGRNFGAQDRDGGPKVLLISEAFARRYWPAGDAVGARIRIGPNPEAEPWEIIGIVGDVRNDLTTPEPEPWMYTTLRQVPIPFTTFLVKAEGDPSLLIRPMHRALAEIDPDMPLDRAMLLTEALGERLAGRRLPVVLMLGFGVLALVLSSVGVYAMFSAMAAAREREFGVRLALGASRRGIAWLVLRQGAVWMAIGLAGGAVGVVFVVRAVRGLLYGVPPFDPVSLAAAVLTLVACGTLALIAPVRRATRADPIEVMR